MDSVERDVIILAITIFIMLGIGTYIALIGMFTPEIFLIMFMGTIVFGVYLIWRNNR